jgi:hypothetical protein
MKMTARVMFCAALISAGATGASAQGITIDTNDVKAMYAVGTTTALCFDTLTTQLPIGNTGASSWDFSTLLTHTSMHMTSVVPSLTPYFATNFPSATHALSAADFTYKFFAKDFGDVVLKGLGYYYMTLSGSELLDHGLKGVGNVYLFGGSVVAPAQGQWTRSPGAIYYHLPMRLDSSWTTTYKEILVGSATILNGTWPVGPDTTSHVITYTVDAYGPLKIPGGATQEALRMRKVDLFTTKNGSGARVGYVILAKNGASVQFNVADTSAVSGTTAVYSIQWTGATPTAVRQISNAPVSFGLAQNYPNPFNPSTKIHFTVPERQAVTLRVYNLLGEEVATLVDQVVNAGENVVEFKATGLPTGMYLYKLQAGSAMQTRRMLLVR